MTPQQLAGRLRGIATGPHSEMHRRLLALAVEIEQDTELDTELREQAARRETATAEAADMEALVRVTQEERHAPGRRPRRWWLGCR